MLNYFERILLICQNLIVTNYTDPTKTGEFSTYLRQGDKTNTPPDNEATDREIVSKMANLLEGLQFPYKRSIY